MLKIKRINESDFELIFVFGDLHGCLGLFDAMLEKINLTKNDLIVILGDSCDRGEDASVISALRRAHRARMANFTR